MYLEKDSEPPSWAIALVQKLYHDKMKGWLCSDFCKDVVLDWRGSVTNGATPV